MNKHLHYILRIADDSLILGQRMAEWCGHGPILEEDIAMTNISLDLFGQATNLLEYAAKIQGEGKNADQLAFLRFDKDYFNSLLIEQPNGDFGMTMMRQFLFDAFRKPFFEALLNSKDEQLAAIAEKSLKETKYHLKHSSEWIIRLGDGTEESNTRVQDALNTLWRYTDELFFSDEIDIEMLEKGIGVDLQKIKAEWSSTVQHVFELANLKTPDNHWQFKGGRIGQHSEHLGHLLSEMQYMQRAYPNMEW